MAANEFERGAEWREWDLHIHTPASFHWHGKRFEADASSPANAALVDEMIAALNAAEPAVFAIMGLFHLDPSGYAGRRLYVSCLESGQ